MPTKRARQTPVDQSGSANAQANHPEHPAADTLLHSLRDDGEQAEGEKKNDVEQREQAEKPKRGRGQPRLFQTAADMEARVNKYFADLDNKEERYVNEKTGIPTIIRTPAYYGRLILEIGASYSTIEPYENGDYDDDTNKFSEVLSRARALCEADLFEGAAKSRYNDRVVNAALMRHHGFAVKTETAVSGSVVHQLDQGQIMQLYESAVTNRMGRLPDVTGEVLEAKTEDL